MLTASGRMRSSPVRGDKKGALWAVPYGYIVPALRTASRVDGVVLGVCSVMRRYGRLGQCIQHSSYGLYAADYTAIGGSQNGLLRFVSFSTPVRSPLTSAQGVILAVHAAQNYGFKNCLRRLRTFFAKKVLRTPKNAQGII